MGMKNKLIKPYATACLETGQELGIEVFDLWTEMQKVEVRFEPFYLHCLVFFDDDLLVNGNVLLVTCKCVYYTMNSCI
jgi:hypothetical protein